MSMSFLKNKSIIALGIILVLLSAAFFAIRPTVLEKTRVLTLEMSSKLLNAEVRIGSVDMPHPTKVQINNLVIVKDDLNIAEIPRLTLNLAIWNIFAENKLLLIDTVSVRNPTIRLKMDEQSRWNIADLLKPQPASKDKFASLIVLTNARVEVELNGKNINGVINGSVDARTADDNFTVDLNTNAEYIGDLKVMGMISANKQGRLSVKSEHLELAALQGLSKHYLPKLSNLKGSLENVDIIWQNEKEKKLLNGHFYNKNVQLTYKHNEDRLFAAEVNGPLSFKDSEFKFDQTKVKINEQLITLSGGVVGKNETWIPNNLKLTLQDADIAKLLADQSVQGKVDAEMVVNNKNGEIIMNGSLKSKELKGFDYTAYDVNIPFRFEKNKLYVENALLKTLDGKIKLKALFDIKDKKYSLEIDGEEIDLAKANIVEDMQGRTDVTLLAMGKMTENDKLDGVYKLRLGGFEYKGLAVNDLVVDISKEQENIGITNGTAMLANGSSVAFMGSIFDHVADVFFVSEALPLELVGKFSGVAMSGTANVGMRLRGALSNPEIDLQIKSSGGVLAGQQFDALTANTSLKNKILAINEFQVVTSPIMDTLGGAYNIRGTVNFANMSPIMDLRVVAETIRIDGIASKLFNSEVTGYFSTDTIVKGSLDNPDASGVLRLEQGSVMGFLMRSIYTDYAYHDGELNISNTRVRSITGMTMNADGKMYRDGSLDVSLQTKDLNLSLLPVAQTYSPEGRVSFVGKIGGKWNRPQLTGLVEATQITVSGQMFNDFKGNISSDAGRVTNIAMDFKQGAGIYSFEGGMDYPNNFVYGKIITTNADIRPMLAIGGQNINVEGFLDGEVYLNRRGKGTGLEIIGNLNNAKAAGVPIQKAEIDLLLDKKKFVINKFLAAQGAGYLVARGTADWHGNAKIELDGKALNAKMLGILFKNNTPVSGLMDFTATISGATLKPVVDTQMFIDGGSYAGASFDGFAAKVKVDTSDKITVKELSLTRGNFKTTVDGYIPFDAFKAKDKRSNTDSQMNLNLHLNNAHLGLLVGKYIDSADGDITGKIRIAGTIDDPKLYGSLKMQNASIRPRTFKKPITNINMDLLADGNNFVLNELSARSGKGNIKIEGSIGMLAGELTSYNLQGSAVNFDLESQYIKGALQGNFNLQPKRNRPHLKAMIVMENMDINIPGVPELSDDPLPRVGLDIDVKLGKNVRFYNRVFFDMELQGDLKIGASTLFPIIDGNLKVTKGRVDYLRTPFKIQNATISWPIPGSFVPHAKINATTRLLQTDVKFISNGPVTQMNIMLSSEPPMSQQEIFRLLTLKTLSKSSQVGASEAEGLLLTGLQMGVLGDMEYEITKRLNLSEFRIYQGALYTGTSVEMARSRVVQGRENARQYNLLVSKYLTDKLLVGYTFSNDFKYSLLYTQYNFNKNLNFGAAFDENKKMRYVLEYKMSF